MLDSLPHLAELHVEGLAPVGEAVLGVEAGGVGGAAVYAQGADLLDPGGGQQVEAGDGAEEPHPDGGQGGVVGTLGGQGAVVGQQPVPPGQGVQDTLPVDEVGQVTPAGPHVDVGP